MGTGRKRPSSSHRETWYTSSRSGSAASCATSMQGPAWPRCDEALTVKQLLDRWASNAREGLLSRVLRGHATSVTYVPSPRPLPSRLHLARLSDRPLV